jgi:hypothetical protein
MSLTRYPYWLVQTRVGRLAGHLHCFPQYRGTPIERQIKSGHIGGSTIVEQRTCDPRQALQWLQREKSRGKDVEVYVVEGFNRPRRKLGDPYRELGQSNKTIFRPGTNPG